MKANAPETTGTLRGMLGEAMAALMNRKITLAASNAIVSCARDLLKLFKMRTRYMELAQRDGLRTGKVPTTEKLRQALKSEDSAAIISAAKRFRADIKPVLEGAKAQVNALK